MGIFEKIFGKKGDDASLDKKNEKREAASSAPVFKPFVIQTEDIPQTLQETSQKYHLSMTQLDFRIVNYETLVKMKKENEWIDVDKADWPRFNKPQYLLNPEFDIKQNYEIEIFRYEEAVWHKAFHMHLARNKNKTKVTGHIKAASKLFYIDGLKDHLIEMVEKKMVMAHILIGVWEGDYPEVLDDIAAKTRVRGEYFFEEEKIFDVAICPTAIPSRDDKLIFHYKKKGTKKSDKTRIDHSRRGFLYAVEKGEIVIEYIKPKEGTPGRNCQGEYLPVEKPKITNNMPNFKVSENIEVEEDEDRIVYKARRNGYIVYVDNRYDIKEEMEIDEVTFKKTGSIDAGPESEVKLHINEQNYMKDAVGTGVEVEAAEVNVKGSVGASSVIKAEDVHVGGQTHQTSLIEAVRATLNIHRGILKVSEYAKITRLEGGKAEGKNIEISQVIGGEIRAMKIKIDLLGSNSKIFAVSRIEIGKMTGENNRLVIDAAEIPIYRTEILSLEKKLEGLNREVEKEERTLEQKRSIKEKSKPAIEQLKKRVMADHKQGVQPKPAFVTKLKQFQHLIDAIYEQERAVSVLKEEIDRTIDELRKYQEMVAKAQIVIHGEWQPYTTVEFHLLAPQITLTYTPVPGSGHQIVYLEPIEDGESYKIATKELQQ